eukprot:4368910-Alexandrium_andersonii.AAC.1
MAAAHELQSQDEPTPAAGLRLLFCDTAASATQAALTRLRTSGHVGYVTLLAFARAGEADTLEHAWLTAASIRQWGSQVACE